MSVQVDIQLLLNYYKKILIPQSLRPWRLQRWCILATTLLDEFSERHRKQGSFANRLLGLSEEAMLNEIAKQS
jgi:hypothetical protein